MTFTFNASSLSGDVVVGEQMYHNDIEVATHIDLTDEGQTVTVTPPSTPKTGDSIPLIPIISLLIAAAGGIVAIVVVKKSKKN